MVTIVLKRVENPLEFGVVVVNEQGRIQRFLEKPTWGQVFSDTVNTGIYVLEPEVFDHIPADTKYDFSQELFPKLFEMGAPLYGYVADGYWQDIGSLPQYLAANRDLLDGKVKAQLPGIELHNRIFLGDGVNLDSLENMQGPRLHRQLRQDRLHGLHRGLLRARQQRGGQGARRDAQQRGRRQHLHRRLGQGVRRHHRAQLRPQGRRRRSARASAVGDESVIGEQAYIAPDVKIYPNKTVESGRADPQQHHLGVARQRPAVRQGRHHRAHQRRHHRRARAQDGHGLRHGAQEGRQRVHQPRRPPGVAGHQARHHLRPQLHRRRRARPARRQQRHQPLRGQERQLPGRHARAHRQLGPGDDPDPAVRAARAST